MKIALYIEDGLEQIVLTPDTATERGVLGKLLDGNRSLSVKEGKFYECQGGWVRQASYGERDEDKSVMIVLRPKE